MNDEYRQSASELAPPPEFGTVLSLDGTERSTASGPVVVTRKTSLATIVGVSAGVALIVGVSTWFVASGVTTPAATVVNAAMPAAPLEKAPDAAAPVAAPLEAPRCATGMVEVKGGSFFMGSDADDAVLRAARPAHKVLVNSFCIDAYEVTVEAYRGCSSTGECKRAYRDASWPQGSSDAKSWTRDQEAHSALCNEGLEGHEQHPVNCLSWHQAQAFCESRDARLPTETEWEFAARGSDGRVYSWGDSPPDSERMNGCGAECTAWREAAELSQTPQLYEADDGFVGTAPVGSFSAGKTQTGLHDLAGNVFEWTSSVFEPYDEAERLAARDPDRPTKRVIRGGAFNSFLPSFADPALRFGQVEDAHPHAIGFRCASDVTGE